VDDALNRGALAAPHRHWAPRNAGLISGRLHADRAVRSADRVLPAVAPACQRGGEIEPRARRCAAARDIAHGSAPPFPCRTQLAACEAAQYRSAQSIQVFGAMGYT
jgi:hypothetical protein